MLGRVHRPAPNTELPDPDRGRRLVGLTFFIFGVLGGLTLLVLLFLVFPLFETRNPGEVYIAMLIGAALALPAGAIYLTVPRLLDRYDPEPLYALWGCLLWGALAACGFSAAINSLVGALVLGLTGSQTAADAIGATVSAPLVEEFFKGLGVFGVFFFLRREFDGIVDGVIYGVFIALGFATVENVVYYSQGAMAGNEVLAGTIVVRGVLSPWVHPVFTAMTGFGFGVARESHRTLTKVAAPVIGYGLAVFLHFVWNASATFFPGVVTIILLPLWGLFLVAFFSLILGLVVRFGRIIRQNLLDEVALGTIDQSELNLVCSAFGVLRARLRHGKKGEEFVRATARLALSKWHAARAMQGQAHTVSMDFILPLRRRIAELKSSL